MGGRKHLFFYEADKGASGTPEQAVEQAAEATGKAAEATEAAAAKTADTAEKGALEQIGGILESVQKELKRFADYMDAAVSEEGDALEHAAQEEAEQPTIETPPAPERFVRRFGRKVKRNAKS